MNASEILDMIGDTKGSYICNAEPDRWIRIAALTYFPGKDFFAFAPL